MAVVAVVAVVEAAVIVLAVAVVAEAVAVVAVAVMVTVVFGWLDGQWHVFDVVVAVAWEGEVVLAGVIASCTTGQVVRQKIEAYMVAAGIEPGATESEVGPTTMTLDLNPASSKHS